MKRKRFSGEPIVAVLKQAEVGVPMAELIRKVGISEQTFYRWKKQYVGLEVDQVRPLMQLQEENPSADGVKRLVADLQHCPPHQALGCRTPQEFLAHWAPNPNTRSVTNLLDE